MNKIVSVLFLLVICFAGQVCHGQENTPVISGLTAVGWGSDVYYLVTDKDGFAIYHAKSSYPAKCYYLDSYNGSPQVSTVYNGYMVAFFENGAVLGYGPSSGTTFQNFDKSYKPLDAEVFNDQLYLLAAGINNYTVFKLEGNKWVTVTTVSTTTPLANSQIFFYDEGLYLAGTDQQGELFCDIIWSEDGHGREIAVSELNKKSHLIDTLVANRSVVFILAQGESDQTEYYAAVFVNNQLSNRSKLEIDTLPELAAGKFSFLSCGDDLALAVHDGDKISVQKYDVTGTRVGQTTVSYSLSVSDISENKYIRFATMLGPVIVVLTVIFRFKKAMTGGVVLATASGLPSPLGLRVPAFVVDFFLMLFVVEMVMKVLADLTLIDLELWQSTMQNLPNPFDVTAKVNINMSVLWQFYLLVYLVMIIYFTLFEWLISATPGKMLFGLKVVDGTTLTAGGISFWRILLRNVYRILELIPFAVPLVLILMVISPRRQRSGDMIANTTVVLGRAPKKNGTKIDEIV